MGDIQPLAPKPSATELPEAVILKVGVGTSAERGCNFIAEGHKVGCYHLGMGYSGCNPYFPRSKSH